MEHRWCVVDLLNWRLKQELMLRVIIRIFVKQFVNKTVIKMYLTEKKTIFVYTQRSSSFVQFFFGGEDTMQTPFTKDWGLNPQTVDLPAVRQGHVARPLLHVLTLLTVLNDW